MKIIDVNMYNVDEVGVYCIKNKKSTGYRRKTDWFRQQLSNGLRMLIVVDQQGKQLGFIEFVPSESAWRPVQAPNYYFIQCMVLFGKNVRNQRIGTTLLNSCEAEARSNNKSGICSVTSFGPWMANKTLFVKNGFESAGQLERFELMFKPFHAQETPPRFIDWTKQRKNYAGWNLLFADQCPWHEKAISDIGKSAEANGIELRITRITTPEEAQKAPSGFGTFSLIKDGKLLADHCISRTRFENIIRKENSNGGNSRG